MLRNLEVLSLVVLALFSVSLSGCVKQKEAQNKVVEFFISAGADQRNYNGAVDIDSFFPPSSEGRYILTVKSPSVGMLPSNDQTYRYGVVRPSTSEYTKYSSEAIRKINNLQASGSISPYQAQELVPIIRELKMVFDLYQGLEEQGMVRGQFYYDMAAFFSAGMIMVIDAQAITDPAKIQNLAWSWIKKQLPVTFSMAERKVGLRKGFYVLNDRWVVLIVATTDESYEHLTKNAPGART